MLENLKKLRTEHKISQEALGSIVGVSQQAINKYENHNVEPDIATLIKIANYFDVSVDFLIGNTQERHKCESVKEYDLNKEEQLFVKAFRKTGSKEKQIIQMILDNDSKKKK